MKAGTTRAASPFSRSAVLGVVVVGFAAFLAMIYFIGAGDTGNPQGRGAAHASANGLNGYAGLVDLLEAEGINVNLSRSREGMRTPDLLVLTPPLYTDPEELGDILEDRAGVGPTLVILPKWSTAPLPDNLSEEDSEEARDDFVQLTSANPLPWTAQLPEPFAFSHERDVLEDDAQGRWQGLGRAGKLPTSASVYAQQEGKFETLIRNAQGRALAMHVIGEPGTPYYEDAHWTTLVVEPDLMNNFGLADADRAGAAIALVRETGYLDMQRVTFDLTLHGYGGSVNLLTLAFQPPFLAATLCLILAIVIIGWRAFLRFGPSAASAPEIAFGKQRLVANGAGLIVRARRLGLLAQPYAALMERRIGRALGLARPDAALIDAALKVRLPREEPFSRRADRLQAASKPADILRAAQSLNDLYTALSDTGTGPKARQESGLRTGTPTQ